jgi:thiol-disulfide isomerase/thioredoxin
MKKLLASILLVTSFAQAQHTIKGTMDPAPKTAWVILYKIEGAKQVFLQNTNIKIDSISVDGIKKTIGKFEFTLPEKTTQGAYRTTYNLKGGGFIDFIYNKENVSFKFNPENSRQTVTFSESKETILYLQYQSEIFDAQEKLDSIQFSILNAATLALNRLSEKAYKKAYKEVNKIQKKYLTSSKDKYIAAFVKANSINYSPKAFRSIEKYRENRMATFFDEIDFSNQTLFNSSFLVEKIINYIFYINTSEDFESQQKLYKASIAIVFSKIPTVTFKKDILQLLISEFGNYKNIEIVDVLFDEYYSTLPVSLQNEEFKTEKLALLASEIGRTAPDFSWEEDGKTVKLSELESAENYVLLFWSTGCSHCLKEIPLLYEHLKGNEKVKVIAFAMEKDKFGFDTYKELLSGWHHVLGLGKWENKIAQIYNIHSTPNYFILDANKKITAKPVPLEELKTLVEKL